WSCVRWFFFFQAEDGIRDSSVTGVQTCALPISFWTGLGKLYASILFKPDSQPKGDELGRINEIFKKAAERANDDPTVFKDVADRSEERRVGKECRCQWRRYDWNKTSQEGRYGRT